MLRLALHAARSAWPSLRDLPLRAAIALGSAGPETPARPDRLGRALAIILPVATAAWWAIPQLTIVMSPSIDAWVVRADPGPIRRGDLVMFELSHPLAGPKAVNVTKHALCLPGDQLTMVETPGRNGQGEMAGARQAAYRCNGVPLGLSKIWGRNGQRLAHFHWHDGPVPAGLAYVGSANPDSFDSRYFGFIPLSRLQRMRRVL